MVGHQTKKLMHRGTINKIKKQNLLNDRLHLARSYTNEVLISTTLKLIQLYNEKEKNSKK